MAKPGALEDRHKREIERGLKRNPQLSPSWIARSLDVDVSVQSVIRAAHQMGWARKPGTNQWEKTS